MMEIEDEETNKIARSESPSLWSLFEGIAISHMQCLVCIYAQSPAGVRDDE